MKIEIKCRFSGKVLFAHDTECNTLLLTLEKGVEAGAKLSGSNLTGAYLYGANLHGANLYGSNLTGAYLSGANLHGANLYGSNLTGAYLSGANLSGANLSRTYLTGTNLDGANLSGAKLDDKSKLIGKRPIFQIGPIGSRSSYFVAYLTDKGLRLRAGCFFGTRSEFEQRLIYSDETTQIEYRAALALIDTHVKLWTPQADEVKEAS